MVGRRCDPHKIIINSSNMRPDVNNALSVFQRVLSNEINEEGCCCGNLVLGITGKEIEQQKNGKSRGVPCRIAGCSVRDIIEKTGVPDNYEQNIIEMSDTIKKLWSCVKRRIVGAANSQK